MKIFLKWYFVSFILSSFLLLGFILYLDFSMNDIKMYYFELFSQLIEKWIYWLFLAIPFSLYRLTNYLFHSYKNHGKMIFLRRFSFSIILPISLFYSLFNASQWYSKNEGFDYQWNFEIENKTDRAANLFAEDEMQRGMHVFGHIDTTNIQPLIKSNIEWITFVPYADQKDYDSPEVRYYHPTRNTSQNIDSMWSESIQLAHTYGFKVFLKPHVWIYDSSNGKWRSDIFPSSNENWESWKKTYREFILLYAKIAEKNNVEMFCIGTEFTKLAIEKPDFWENLIAETRSIYSGKLTYAANWYQEFEDITFWNQLDYIGVQAYFPLVKNKNPSIKQISKGWKKHLPALKKVAEKFDKKSSSQKWDIKVHPIVQLNLGVGWTTLLKFSELFQLKHKPTATNHFLKLFGKESGSQVFIFGNGT